MTDKSILEKSIQGLREYAKKFTNQGVEKVAAAKKNDKKNQPSKIEEEKKKDSAQSKGLQQ